ncbi:MAG: hypothetical protein M3P48_05770 [Actinomycetota bacterium]|nr:hypothetical protein [Actinomycetota bacterium]
MGDGVLHLVGGGSRSTGSKLLVLGRLMNRILGDVLLPHGALVAVPNRHFVLFHVAEPGCGSAATEAMARFAREAFSEGVDPVSPRLYRWRSGGLSR